MEVSGRVPLTIRGRIAWFFTWRIILVSLGLQVMIRSAGPGWLLFIWCAAVSGSILLLGPLLTAGMIRNEYKGFQVSCVSPEGAPKRVGYLDSLKMTWFITWRGALIMAVLATLCRPVYEGAVSVLPRTVRSNSMFMTFFIEVILTAVLVFGTYLLLVESILKKRFKKSQLQVNQNGI